MKTTATRGHYLAFWLGLLGLLLAGGGAAQAQTKSPKRGLAYDYQSAADLQALAPGTSWWYNYTSVPNAGVAGAHGGLGVEYVPIQWGARLNNGPVTADALAANIPAGTQYLLGFNEPNFRSQSNLTPTQAAAIWPVLQEVARRKNLKLVSPALNYCGDCVQENGVTYYSPTQYLDAFFAACPNCQVDYIALHTYVCEEQYLRQKVAELKKYNKPIWLTEFACGDMADATKITLAVQQKYMLDAVNYLENEPAIFRYSWFSGRNNEIPNINVLGADGQLTALGQQYVSLPFNGPANELNRLTPVAAAASSSESGATGAASATDRNINSRWSSAFADPQYLQLDFGDVKRFTRVKIAWEAAYAKDYQVQASLDGLTWGPLQTVVDGDGGVDDLTGLSGRGRYLRVYGTRRATTFGYSIYEVDVYGTADAALAAAPPGPPDAAGLRLYPNPAATELHLALPGGAPIRSLAVTDALGKTVLTGTGPATTLSIAVLPAGLYVVRVATAHEQFSQRFVKP